MTKVKGITQILILNNRLNYLLGFFILMVVISYVYFANVAVRTVTTIQNIKADSLNIRAEVTELESKYLSIESNINLHTAVSLGLEESSKPIFLVKKDKSKILSLR